MPSTGDQLQVAIDWVFASGPVSVSRYRCHSRAGLGREQRQAAHVIAFPHEGAYALEVGGKSAVIEPNSMVFFNRGEPYRTSHPFGCGDTGSALAISDDVAREAVRAVDPRRAEDGRGPFRAFHAPSSVDVTLLERLLLHRAEHGFSPDGLEETAVHLLAKSVAGSAGTDVRRAANASTRRRREVVEAVKGLLSRHVGEPVSLGRLGRSVSTSVFHLCRLFKGETGMTIHAYRTRLKVRASLEDVAGSERSFTSIALDLGFSSHSHFSAAFRRELGLTPSEVRRRARS